MVYIGGRSGMVCGNNIYGIASSDREWSVYIYVFFDW